MYKSEALLLELLETACSVECWNVTPCGLIDGSAFYRNLLTYLVLKRGGSTFVYNVGTCLPNYLILCHGMQDSSSPL